MTAEKCDGVGGPGVSPWLGAAVTALFLLLYIVPLGGRPLFVLAEARYAEIPREMLAGGDWAALRQAGLRYYEKPPLGYWLNALSQSLFGHNYFAVRLPSALAAGLAALAVFCLVKRDRRDSRRAWAAVMVYLSCVLVFGTGTYAALDSMFALFVCLTMAAYYFAASGRGQPRPGWLVLSGAACAAAFLTKGFTALVIPALTLLVWLPWERRAKRLLTAWIGPVLAAGLVTLPAALVIHAANPGFWDYFFWVEHVGRFLAPADGQHPKAVWFFLPVLAGAALPWTFFLPLAAAEAWNKARTDSLTRYCLSWFVTQFLFFSACGGKLATYILPGFAPLAILVAEAVLDSRRTVWLTRSALAGAGLLLAALAVFMIPLPWPGQEEERRILINALRAGLIPLAVLTAVLCLYAAARSFAANRPRLSSIGWMALSLCAPALAGFHFPPREIEDHKSPSRLLEEVAPLTPPEALVLVDFYSLPSASWHYRRDDVVFFGGPGELRYGLERPEGRGRHFADPKAVEELLSRTLAQARPVAVLARDDAYADLAPVLSGRRPALARQGYRYFWALFTPEGNLD